MRYVKRKLNKLFFTKRWPKGLESVIGSVGFSYPLGSAEQSEAQVTAKVSKALAEFDVKVKMATNSNTEDYHQNEIDILVEANLRRLKQTHGLPHFKVPDQHVIDHNSNSYNKLTAEDIEFPQPTRTVASQEFISSRADLANSLVNIDDVQFKEQTGQKLTMQEKAASATWQALQTKAKKKPKMLYDQWKVYTDFKGKERAKNINTHTRNWNRFCSLIQNRSLNLSDQGHLDLSKELTQTLRDYRDVRLTKVKVATVKREVNSIRACLVFIRNENDFDWRLKKTQLPIADAGEVSERIPLSLEHQKMLVSYCTSPEHSSEVCATMALLYLQGGVMPSEVGRMSAKVQLENLSNAVAPYVSIKGETKTEYRKRPVPVVLGLDVVRENIAATIAWASSPKSTRISQMKNFLEAATGTKDVYVSHGLRHTFSVNCRHSDCRDSDKATLGGWASAGAASDMSMKYGSAGMFDQSNIERLYKVSLDIHRNLI